MADHLVTKFWGLCGALTVALLTLALVAPVGRGGFRPRRGRSEPAQLGRSGAGTDRRDRRARAGAVAACCTRGTVPSPCGGCGSSPVRAGRAPTGRRRRGRCHGGGEGGAAHASARQRRRDADSFRADSLGTHDGQTAESARSSPVRLLPRWAGERTSRLASEGAPGRAEGASALGPAAGRVWPSSVGGSAGYARRDRSPEPRGDRSGSSPRHPEGFASHSSCH